MRKIINTTFQTVFLIMMMIMVTGCGKIETFFIVGDELTIRVDDEQELVLDLDKKIKSELIEYSSSDEKIVTVEGAVIKGISEGEATISITYKEKDLVLTDTAKVIVIKSQVEQAYYDEAKAFEQKVADLNNFTYEDAYKIAQLLGEGDNLSEEVKKYVTVLDKLANMYLEVQAKVYDEIVKAIPEVITEKEKDTIENARSRYEELSDEIKKYVTTLDTLIQKEQQLEEILVPELKVSQTTIKLTLGESLNVEYFGIELINVSSSKAGFSYQDIADETKISIIDDVIKGIGIGKTTFTLGLVNYPKVEPVILTVIVEAVNYFTIKGESEVYIGDVVQYTISPDLEGVTLSSSDKSILELDGFMATAHSTGTVTLIAEYYGQKVSKTVEVIKDTTPPVISSDAKNVTINWNDTFDAYAGMKVTDNKDANVQLMMTSTFDNKKIGNQTIAYSATDSDGNIATYLRTVTVVWNYQIKFIGHAGSYYGIMNTEEAFLYAVDVLHYQAIECDLKQTKDGVFVLAHDDTFGGKTIADTTWEQLKDVTETTTRNQGYPSQNGSISGSGKYTSKICTLERYLDICKQYGVTAVIELKYSKGINNNDQSRMQALMNIIEKKGMLNQVIFLGSQYKCLIWTREHGYSNVPCQYLVNSCESDEVLNRCKQYNFDISINVTGNYSNSDAWLQKYKDAGCKISTYTFTQWVNYKDVQKWIDKGVDFVTCDWQLMEKLELK